MGHPAATDRPDTSDPAFGTYRPRVLTRLLIGAAQTTPLGRGRLRKSSAAWLRARHQGPLDAHLFGCQVRLALDGNSSETKALLKPALYARTARQLVRHVSAREDAMVVDIGANAGLFSLLCASEMRTGALVAIEPQPQLFTRLKTNLVTLNPVLAARVRFHLFNCAAGPEPGSLSLHVPEQLGQASLRALEGAKVVDVPVRPLLDLLHEAGAVKTDLLKIDVEGFEDEVLLPFFKAAPQTLWPQAIVLEHCHRERWQADCEAFLLKSGYRLRDKGRTDLVLVRTGT